MKAQKDPSVSSVHSVVKSSSGTSLLVVVEVVPPHANFRLAGFDGCGRLIHEARHPCVETARRGELVHRHADRRHRADAEHLPKRVAPGLFEAAAGPHEQVRFGLFPVAAQSHLDPFDATQPRFRSHIAREESSERATVFAFDRRASLVRERLGNVHSRRTAPGPKSSERRGRGHQ